jgi:hypothetical protein
VHSRHAPATHAGIAAVGHEVGFVLPTLKSTVQAVQPLLMHTGKPLGQSADVAQAWQANVSSLPGDGQFPPPLIVEPRQAHGLNETRLPHGSFVLRGVHVPSTRPVTLP